MRISKYALFTTLLTTLILSGSASASELVVYSAEYQATASGLSATAERSLQLVENQQYVLENKLEVRVAGARLGAIEETSRFNWIEGDLQPDAYRYSQSGIVRKRERVRFDWTENIATSTEDDDSWEHGLTPGIADKLSYQLVLRQALQNSDKTDIEFQIIDTDEIETHLYRVTGNELTETSLGSLNTVKVERIREGDSKRSTTFWLATDWNMLLVRFLQTDSSGSKTELLLNQATVNGEQVSALP